MVRVTGSAVGQMVVIGMHKSKACIHTKFLEHAHAMPALSTTHNFIMPMSMPVQILTHTATQSTCDTVNMQHGQHSTPTPGTSHVRCPRCLTRFLNVPPEKLMLGATVTPKLAPPARLNNPALKPLKPPPPAMTPPHTTPAAAMSSVSSQQQRRVPVVDVQAVVQAASAASGVPVDAMWGCLPAQRGVVGEGDGLYKSQAVAKNAIGRMVAVMQETVVGREDALRWGIFFFVLHCVVCSVS